MADQDTDEAIQEDNDIGKRLYNSIGHYFKVVQLKGMRNSEDGKSVIWQKTAISKGDFFDFLPGIG